MTDECIKINFILLKYLFPYSEWYERFTIGKKCKFEMFVLEYGNVLKGWQYQITYPLLYFEVFNNLGF